VGDLRAEIIAAQDQALLTKYNAIKILQTEADNKWRLCQNFDETINGIIPACTVLVIEKYINRHDTVCA